MLHVSRAWAVLLLLAPPGQALAAQVCYHSAYASELAELIDQAEVEYPKWESGRFVDLSKQVADTVPCLEDKIRTDLAARVHRVMGLRARIVDADTDRARMAFAAARSLQPKYTFPVDMVGATDPEHTDYVAIPASLEITARIPKPSEGTIRFDGRQTLERPTTFATIFQHIDDAGKVKETVYLWPGDPAPAYFTMETTGPVVSQDSNRVVKFVVGALSAGLAGAGVTLLANGAWDQGNTCESGLEDSACVLQAKDRVVAGAVLTGVGLAGFIGTGITVSDDGVGFHLAGRW